MDGARRRLRLFCLGLCPLFFLRRCQPSAGEVGLAGERLAARHLVRAGWTLLGTRLHTPSGEVDLVALDGSVLVAVEVKTGRRPYRDRGPGRRLGPQRRRRLGRAAAHLGARRRSRARVDLIEVIYGGRGAALINHQRDLCAPDRGGCVFPDLDGDGPLFLG
ncbi:MAG: YraN family protein [Planctomycetota bacterium]|nr:YraN family protein [Planctomycetota bacterium]MDP6838640.1 YraN family protein [Planctomycetota bacterium]